MDDFFDEQESDEKGQICSECRRQLEVGVDVWTLEKGVVGMRGVVPLGSNLCFCSEACLIQWFDDIERIKAPRRIP